MMGRQLIGILSIGTVRPCCVVIERASNDQQLTIQAGVMGSLYEDDDREQLWTQLLRDAEKKANVTIDQLYIDVPHDWFSPFEAEIVCQGVLDEHGHKKAMEEMALLLQQQGYRQCYASLGDFRRLENGDWCCVVCVLAVREGWYQKLEKLTEGMGVRLAGVRSAMYDAAQYFSSEQEKKSGVVYVHMNEEGVSYVAFQDNLLCRMGHGKKGLPQVLGYIKDVMSLSGYQSWQLLRFFGFQRHDAAAMQWREFIHDMIDWLAQETKPLELDIGGALNWIVAQGEVRGRRMLSLMRRHLIRPMRHITEDEAIFTDRMTEFLAMAYSVMGGSMPPLARKKPLPIANEHHKIETEKDFVSSVPPRAKNDMMLTVGFSNA